METKTLKVYVTCEATYESTIEVPESFTREEAIEFAKEHMEELNVEDLTWLKDLYIDEDLCELEDDEDDEDFL